MKTTYYCRHSTFDNEYFACYLTRGSKTVSIGHDGKNLSPELYARHMTDMKMYGYVETYHTLPIEMKIEFILALKELGGSVEELEFQKPRF